MTDGLHDIPADEYHADAHGDTPSLSAGCANTLLTRSPAHAWFAHPRLNPNWQPTVDAKFDVGHSAHRLLLEGVESVVIVDAADWRTKAAKETREEAHAAGMRALLVSEWDAVQGMVACAREQLESFDVTPTPFTDGKAEQVIFWTEPNGVHCRARLDWLHDDMSAIDDYKTTRASANPEAWTRKTLYGIGADVQVAFYLRGMEKVTGKRPECRYVVQETFPPYALSVVSLGPDVLALANAKVDAAIAKWAECLETDTWPAYPTKVCWAELPAWEEARWLEREAMEEAA